MKGSLLSCFDSHLKSGFSLVVGSNSKEYLQHSKSWRRSLNYLRAGLASELAVVVSSDFARDLPATKEVGGFARVSLEEPEVAGNYLCYRCKGCFKRAERLCFGKIFELDRGFGCVESGSN